MISMGSLLTEAQVAEILADPDLCGDGPPSWKGAPSSADAKAKQLPVNKRLARSRNKVPGAASVAARVSLCSPPNGSCRSGASIPCARAVQRFIVRVGASAFVSACPDDLYFLTVIPEMLQAQIGALSVPGLDRVQAAFMSAMKTVPDARFLGGWDISLNDERQRQLGKYWQPHLHLVVETRSKKTLKRALLDRFSSNRITWPVRFEPRFDRSNKGYSYLFKAGHFDKKVFYRNAFDGTWKVKLNRFTASEEVELYLWLDALGLANRAISSDDICGRVP
jgi:hypothetical protein